MRRPAFGHREAKTLVYSKSSALKVHADYVRAGAPRKAVRPRRDGSPVDRMLAWLSYFTLVFTAAVVLTPDSAAAAAFHIHRAVTTALPV